ncbi:hypothetical protein [Actinophytocola glycyrrhizae]|uniref:Uncharacterized protein n=1 Tax=Actinophytocola glycyrrhizae TaxID=2044873 RepID=A0ABV9RWC7_9PSEU
MAKYGYDDGMLLHVIGATETALGQMNQVNSAVLGISGQMPVVNNSTSGVKLAGLLGDWSSDYQKIVTQLSELNTKAQGLLQLNRNIEVETGGAAQ